MERIRTMKPLSNANYFNHNLDAHLYHNVHLQNVAPVEKDSCNSASVSHKSVGQASFSESHMTMQGCSIRLPLQQVSQPCRQNEFLQNLKQKVLQEEIQMAHQLNEVSMHQQLQKPQRKNMLDEYRISLNDPEKEQSALFKHNNLASNQGVLPSICSPQEQQRNIKAPLQADAVKEEPLNSTFPGQHAYVDDWFIQTYMQIQMLRESYSPEVDFLYKLVKDSGPEPLGGASLTRYQKKIGVANMIIRVLSLRKSDLARYPKDKVRQRLDVVKWHLDTIRTKGLGAMSHHEQHHPPSGHSTFQLQTNRNMEIISSQFDRGLTNQHACTPQSSIQQGFSFLQNNSINSLCNGSVGNDLCSFQNSPKSLKQESFTNHAIQTNVVALPNVECQFGPSLLHHGLWKSLHKQNLYSQQNSLPSVVNSLVPIMSTSSVNSSHAVKQKEKKQKMRPEEMSRPVLKSQIEKKMQQMVVQKESSLQQHKSSIQSAGYSPRSLTSSLPATDHENESFCAKNTVYLQRPLVPVEQSQTASMNYTPDGSSPEILASPLSIEFDIPDTSLQLQPIERLIKVVKSMSSEALCASLHDFNAVINMVDYIATPATSTESEYSILETNTVSSGSSSCDKVNRQISATAFNSLSSFSRGTLSKRGCNQAEYMISPASYGIKKQKIEQDRDIFGEIRAINLQLIETSLDVDLYLPEDAALAGVGDGTIIKCSYTALGTLAKCLRMQYTSPQTLPDFIVRWLVPADYPHSSPMLLDTLPGCWSEVFEDLSEKLVSKFNHLIRTLSQPISLEDMVRNWDASARAVFTEFAEGRVGKSLGSNLRTWENCTTTL